MYVNANFNIKQYRPVHQIKCTPISITFRLAKFNVRQMYRLHGTLIKQCDK